MPFKRFPHSGTIAYYSGATYSSVGIKSLTTGQTIAVARCRVEKNTTRWAVSAGGDKIDFRFTVFMPKMTAATIAFFPIGSDFTWKNTDYKIIEVFDNQQNTELSLI